MINWKIYPYKQGSRSAKALSEALGGRVLKLEGSKWKPNPARRNLVINWGSSTFPVDKYPQYVNHPDAIKKASNKLLSLNAFWEAEISSPKFSEDKNDALIWLANDRKVVCRTVLNGHSGAGIVLASSKEELVDAPLYTEYIPKQEEFRVHVMKGEAFFVQRKARNLDVPDENVNWQVRNHDNGFIFAHKDVEIEEEAKELAVNAVNALGLDFGAVDLIQNRKGFYVLEVNTACGLEGTTLEKYVEAFTEAFV